jgi:hypothetical protein
MLCILAKLPAASRFHSNLEGKEDVLHLHCYDKE